jgi:hypothetical protein
MKFRESPYREVVRSRRSFQVDIMTANHNANKALTIRGELK